MDQHIGDKPPGLLPLLGTVDKGALQDACVQGDPLFLRLPHSIVYKHCQLPGRAHRNVSHRLQRGALLKPTGTTALLSKDQLLSGPRCSMCSEDDGT